MDELYERQKGYYHRRALEYDATAWEPATPGQVADVEGLIRALASLPLADTLDVACGTGFLTQHLRGTLTLLDASEAMLAVAATRLPEATLVCAEALPMPFPDSSFERVVSSQFYDHLRPPERRRFLAEARRIAPELVLVEQTRGPTHREGPEQRTLRDGTTHEIYTAYFSPTSLLDELGSGELLYAGQDFLAARTRWDELG